MFSFDAILKEQLAARPKKTREVGRYYPSEAGNCVRRSHYSLFEPEEPSPDLLLIFEMGNVIHEFVSNVLSRSKKVALVGSEERIRIDRDGYFISGRIDDAVVVNASGEKLIIEVKSCKDLSYVVEPSRAYRLQLQLYLHALNVRRGFLLYVEKSTLKSKCFEIVRDEAQIREAFERFDLLHESIRKRLLPPAEARLAAGDRWQCDFCPYERQCATAGVAAQTEPTPK